MTNMPVPAIHPVVVSLVVGNERKADYVLNRFEKSLYDLIRGLRNHKGNEKEYIQKTLKECRAEVRSQDMGWFFYSW